VYKGGTETKRKERRERKGGGEYDPRRKGEECRTTGLRIRFHSTEVTKKLENIDKPEEER
jgi:hypothetical protein